MTGSTGDTPDSHELIVWQVLDGKPGHQNQVRGLVDSLTRIVPARAYRIDVDERLRGFRGWLPGRCQSYDALPRPDLLIAAGHATHLPLLRLRQRYGGITAVLMKPTLPLRIFDVCLIPNTHTFSQCPDNVILTEGALNRVRPSKALDDGRGLILVGGPSSHYEWSDNAVLDQISQITSRDNDHQWTIATSRRTPAAILGRVSSPQVAGPAGRGRTHDQ